MRTSLSFISYQRKKTEFTFFFIPCSSTNLKLSSKLPAPNGLGRVFINVLFEKGLAFLLAFYCWGGFGDSR